MNYLKLDTQRPLWTVEVVRGFLQYRRERAACDTSSLLLGSFKNCRPSATYQQ